MTTPFKAKSLTTQARPVVPVVAPPVTPAPPPPPIIPPTPRITRPSAWSRAWTWQGAMHATHRFGWWCAVIAISLISARILFGAMATWPAFRGYAICFGIFWFTCIGMLPITAIARTGQNIMKDIFDHD